MSAIMLFETSRGAMLRFLKGRTLRKRTLLPFDTIPGQVLSADGMEPSGIDSRLESIRNLPIPLHPEWWEQLQQHHPILLPKAEEALDISPYKKISLLNLEDVKSAAFYGIWSGNRICGICGIEYLRHHAELGESVQTALQKIANLIGLSLDRKRIQEQLQAVNRTSCFEYA